MAETNADRVEQLRGVLGLASAATIDDVRRCHRRQMLRNHPDRGGSEERARLINEAREFFLTHPEQLVASKLETTERSASPVSKPKAATVSAEGLRRLEVIPAITHVIWLLLKFSVVAYLALLLMAVVGWLVCTMIQLLT